jgi:hypothetical protein
MRRTIRTYEIKSRALLQLWSVRSSSVLAQKQHLSQAADYCTTSGRWRNPKCIAGKCWEAQTGRKSVGGANIGASGPLIVTGDRYGR